MSENSTKTDSNDYELREEYDLSQLPIMPKGRYAPERRASKNLVLLEPDIAQAFPSDDSVNAALRFVMRIADVPQKQEAPLPPASAKVAGAIRRRANDRRERPPLGHGRQFKR